MSGCVWLCVVVSGSEWFCGCEVVKYACEWLFL